MGYIWPTICSKSKIKSIKYLEVEITASIITPVKFHKCFKDGLKDECVFLQKSDLFYFYHILT